MLPSSFPLLLSVLFLLLSLSLATPGVAETPAPTDISVNGTCKVEIEQNCPDVEEGKGAGEFSVDPASPGKPARLREPRRSSN